jgi:hypothetical protein
MSHARATGWRYGLLSAALLLTFGTGAHAAFIPLIATLDGAQETPPNASPGTGGAAFILDDVSRTLLTTATFSALTGTTTSADIEDGTGLIVHPIPPVSPTNPTGFPIGVLTGSFIDFWTGLTPANVAALEAGSYFINIRTSAFRAGEIQRQIAAAIPEPASLVMLFLGVATVAMLAWRKRKLKLAA